MTVSQLIEILKKFPPDHRVVLDGYEGGLCDVSVNRVRETTITLNLNSEPYFGPHEEVMNGQVKAVYISRGLA